MIPLDQDSATTAPPPEGSVLRLEAFLPYRLSVLSNTVSRGISKAYAKDGLSVHEWRVMAVLGRFPGIPASEVAKRTAMDKVRVSRAVASLAAAGNVERGVDSGDRRRSACASARKAAISTRTSFPPR